MTQVAFKLGSLAHTTPHSVSRQHNTPVQFWVCITLCNGAGTLLKLHSDDLCHYNILLCVDAAVTANHCLHFTVQGDAFEPDQWRDQLQGAVGVVSCLGGFGSNEFMLKVKMHNIQTSSSVTMYVVMPH